MFHEHLNLPQPQTRKERTDHELLFAVADGETQAFDEIVRRYQKPIVQYLVRLVGDYERALELSQETFIRVYTNAGRYKVVSTFSSWIYKIATNLAFNELRRRKKVRFLPLMTNPAFQDDDEEKEKDIPDDSRPLPDEILERKQLHRAISAEMKELPLRFRTPVILRDVQDLAYEDIAKVLDLPVGTVKSRINRGRAMLQKRLGKVL